MALDVGTYLVVAGGVLGLAAFWRLRRRNTREPARALAALACVGRLTELVAQIQQHRGMSGAWLSGDVSFGSRLPARQAAVEAVFSALLQDAALEDGERLPCFTSQDVLALRFRWRELVERLPRFSPEESFQHHCRLLAMVLGWLSALGEARIALASGGTLPAEAVRKVVSDLPALAECLGQARALGSAVAARGRCAPVARVRLHFLVSRATELLGRAAQGAVTVQARQPAEYFLQALRERVLQGDSVAMDAASCFRLGTDAVDAVYGWLAQERAGIERSLQLPPASAAPAADWPVPAVRYRT